MKTVVIFLFAIFFLSCKNNLNKAFTFNDSDDSKDTLISLIEADNTIFMTSVLDYKNLEVFIPFKLKINFDKDIYELRSLGLYNLNCNCIVPKDDFPSQLSFRKNYKKNIYEKDGTYFEIIIEPHYDKYPHKNNTLTIPLYRCYFIKKDIATKYHDIDKNYKFIKGNNKKENHYFNDTIKYKNLKDFQIKHPKYFDVLKNEMCEKLLVDIYLKNKIDSSSIIMTNVYEFKYFKK